MNRKCLIIIVLAVILLIGVAGIIVADNFSSKHGVGKPPGLFKRYITPRSHSHTDRYRMPVLRPDPNNYKILTMKIDESIDYKILDAFPRDVPQSEEVKPRRKKFKLPGLSKQNLWHKPYDLNLKTSPLKTGP